MSPSWCEPRRVGRGGSGGRAASPPDGPATASPSATALGAMELAQVAEAGGTSSIAPSAGETQAEPNPPSGIPPGSGETRNAPVLDFYNPSGGITMTGTPIPIHTRRLDSDKLINAPYEYLTILAQLADESIAELGRGLVEHDRDQVTRACNRLSSIGALAKIAAESL